MKYKPYPWQQSQWQHVRQAQILGKLPHALLLHGIAGLAKQHFSDCLIHSLLCVDVNADGLACGQCRGCHLLATGAHPDLYRVNLQEKAKNIKVDQIRAVKEFLTLSSHCGGYRIVIIAPAEIMNHAAANALLKVLEEPGKGALLLLVCHHPALLPATVLSRCQSLVFSPCETNVAKLWLQQTQADLVHIDLAIALSQGAPLKALAWLDDETLAQRQKVFAALILFQQSRIDPMTLASNFLELDFSVVLDHLISWLLDAIKISSGLNQTEVINIDQVQAIAEFSQKVRPQAHFLLLEKLIEVKRMVLQGSQLNKQLLLEDLLTTWLVVCSHTA
ncbi:MAG: DNA polymerase III subunit delta' [Gammaproteobacteria bacterium]